MMTRLREWRKRHKPRDLIVESNAEWETIRAAETRTIVIPTASPSVSSLGWYDFNE